jgi:predicted phosphate transport protein (TIGR00153 family)
MSFKEWIIPQDKIFYEILEKQSKLVLKAATLFKEMLKEPEDFSENIKKMKLVEHEGDEIVHQMIHKLHKSFITPIDQEDLANLTSLYDDVLDYIDSVANRIFLFKVKNPDGVIDKFAEIIEKQVLEVNNALKQIRKMKQKEIEKSFEKVHSLENIADDLHDDSMVNLFKEKDPIKIIIMKEIYDFLEQITDKCEDVCLVIQDIVLKNA